MSRLDLRHSTCCEVTGCLPLQVKFAIAQFLGFGLCEISPITRNDFNASTGNGLLNQILTFPCSENANTGDSIAANWINGYLIKIPVQSFLVMTIRCLGKISSESRILKTKNMGHKTAFLWNVGTNHDICWHWSYFAIPISVSLCTPAHLIN